MISLIEAKNFRSIKYIHRPLERFHVLVGANASGKTTFFDVLNFIKDILSEKDFDAAIKERLQENANFESLTHMGQGGDIELAVELRLPDEIRKKIWNNEIDTIRYEICLGKSEQQQVYGILRERVLIFAKPPKNTIIIPELFPNEPLHAPSTLVLNNKKILRSVASLPSRQIVKKSIQGRDNYYGELEKEGGRGWSQPYSIGLKRSALAYMPVDESKYPAASWLKKYLCEELHLFTLDSQEMRKPSPPYKEIYFRTDGSNLPWVIEELRKEAHKFQSWIRHLRSALPDIEDIITREIPYNRFRYLAIKYKHNSEPVPSWLVSDGTLRMMALTLPAYLPNLSGTFLIEEPENGIHPQAMETVFQSLSTVHKAQILLASHSPVVLGLVKKEQILFFAKTKEGVTDIVSGAEHPLIHDWQNDINLVSYYATGMLG